MQPGSLYCTTSRGRRCSLGKWNPVLPDGADACRFVHEAAAHREVRQDRLEDYGLGQDLRPLLELIEIGCLKHQKYLKHC